MHQLKRCLKNKVRGVKEIENGVKRQKQTRLGHRKRGKRGEGTTPSAHLRVSQHSPSVLLSALYPSLSFFVWVIPSLHPSPHSSPTVTTTLGHWLRRNIVLKKKKNQREGRQRGTKGLWKRWERGGVWEETQWERERERERERESKGVREREK